MWGLESVRCIGRLVESGGGGDGRWELAGLSGCRVHPQQLQLSILRLDEQVALRPGGKALQRPEGNVLKEA